MHADKYSVSPSTCAVYAVFTADSSVIQLISAFVFDSSAHDSWALRSLKPYALPLGSIILLMSAIYLQLLNQTVGVAVIEIVACVPTMLPDTLPVALPETSTSPVVPVNVALVGTSTSPESVA
jgi:hypothetical protein